MSKEPKPSRSGTSRSYAEKKAKGRPVVSFTLPNETIQLLAELATHHNLSRSAVVDLAIRELSKKMR